MPPSLEQQLTDLLGGDANVSTKGLPDYAVDGVTPRAVVKPSNREAVAEVLRWASSEGLAVVPRGGGTQMGLGNPPRRVDLVLDLSRLDRVLDFQPADLTVTAEAGSTLAQLQQRLAGEGKMVPLEAPLPTGPPWGASWRPTPAARCAPVTVCPGTGSSASAWSAAREWRPRPGDGWSRTLPATT